MSNNFNALLNAAAVATTHPVSGVVAASGTRAATVQANAAAVHGAAAHGMANTAAAASVPAAARASTTGRKMLSRQYTVVENNGTAVGSVPVVDDKPVAYAAAVHGASAYGAASTSSNVPAAAGSSATGRKMLSRQYTVVANTGASVHGGVPVVNDKPVANAAAVHGAAAHGVANTAAAASVPAAARSSTTGRKMLTRQYAVVADNGAVLGGTPVVDNKPAADSIDYQYGQGAATTSTQPVFPPGLPVPTHINGVRLEDTAWYKEHFATGTELAADSKAQRKEPEHRVIANETVGAAAALPRWPPEPPTPSPPPRSLWSVVVNVVNSCFKRKRCDDDNDDAVPKPTQPTADGSQERPAKRARVQHVGEPQPSPKRLGPRRIAKLPQTPKRRGARDTEPKRLSCKGEAAYPTQYYTSDAAMQTDPEPVSPSSVAGPSRQPSTAPPSRTPSLTDAGAAGLSRQPSQAPPSRTPSLTDAGAVGLSRRPSEVPLSRTPSLDDAGAGTASSSTASTVGPIRTAKKGHVRFASYKSHARPRRLPIPPPEDLVGEEPEPEKPEGMLVSHADILACEYRLLFGASNTVSRTEPVDDPSSTADQPESTIRHMWTHPNAPYATYQEVAVQYDYKTRRGTRAGKKVQHRRAVKEAATATASEGEAGAKVDSAA
ncbi:hypothetical protein AURDEDRAFT_187462 [Auricularia subglabra TFB-10046 SS5]|nr:hypothetical protein AURDEDRAFT_187462 [Auricularia subglabra TFB-10046 SS5]